MPCYTLLQMMKDIQLETLQNISPPLIVFIMLLPVQTVEFKFTDTVVYTYPEMSGHQSCKSYIVVFF